MTIHFDIFSRYLVKNSSTLLSVTDYEVAPAEYHRKAVWHRSPTTRTTNFTSPVSADSDDICFPLNWSAPSTKKVSGACHS